MDQGEPTEEQMSEPTWRMEQDPYGEAISRMKLAYHSAAEYQGRMSEHEWAVLCAINDILEAA